MRTATTRTLGGFVAQSGVGSRPDFIVQKTGTGTYLITLPADFKLIGANANITGGGAVSAQVTSITGRTFTVLTLTTAAALVDAPFAFTAVGAT